MSASGQFAALGLNRADVEAHLDEAAAHAAAGVTALLAPLPNDLAGELYKILKTADLPDATVEALVRQFRKRAGDLLLAPAPVEQAARTLKRALAPSACELALRYHGEGMLAGRAPAPEPDAREEPTRPGIPSRMPPRRPPEE